jgi:hypothetical protein
MKRLTSIAVCLLVLLVVSSLRAQESLDATINNLQRQIQVREAIDRDPKTSAALRAANRRTLADKRAQLSDAVEVRIAQLQKYLSTLGTSASAERQYVEASLRNLEAINDRTTGRAANNQATGQRSVSTMPSSSSVRPRVVTQSVNSAARESGNAVSESGFVSPAVVLDSANAGDTVIRGRSISRVTEVLIEIRTRQSDNTRNAQFSHAPQEAPIVYRVTRFAAPGQTENTWPFTVRLSRSLTLDQELRAIPNGEVANATQWVKVAGQNKRVASSSNQAAREPEQISVGNPTSRPARAGVSTRTGLAEGDLGFTVKTSNLSKTTTSDKVEVQVDLDEAAAHSIDFNISVTNGGKEVSSGRISIKKGQNNGTATVSLKKGDNLINVSNANDADEKIEPIAVKYAEPAAAAAPAPAPTPASEDVATLPSNSRFTRAVVGIEQAGASSAESKTNPFLDFFFTTPFKFSNRRERRPVLNPDGSQARGRDGRPLTKWEAVGEPSPRFGAWGEVRLSTTPEQTSSFAVFSSNFVNQATDPTKVVELVKSFDFLAGVEFRALDANGWIWTLIPGVKQRTSLYFTFSGGAISPLSVKRESAQLFNIPDVGDPRRTEFIRRFGDPKSLKYVGFVPLERDRFFRQYYVGLRLKTHYCEDPECDTYKNRFPSIVDLGLGQNEAVTGGLLKSDVRDAANNLIRRRRAWVMRLDAFFPLPFKDASFLYLYGTAMMKIGGGGVKIQNPLFLDTPASTIQITDPNVFVPSPDLQPTRVDRDYYKIGIGVNLTDLFNKKKQVAAATDQGADKSKDAAANKDKKDN